MKDSAYTPQAQPLTLAHAEPMPTPALHILKPEPHDSEEDYRRVDRAHCGAVLYLRLGGYLYEAKHSAKTHLFVHKERTPGIYSDVDLDDERVCPSCRDRISKDWGEKATIPKAEIHATGDVKCSSCHCIHATPEGYAVQPGLFRCQFCKAVSVVSHEMAALARKLSAKSFTRSTY